jgi:hypothetical protein
MFDGRMGDKELFLYHHCTSRVETRYLVRFAAWLTLSPSGSSESQGLFSNA